MIDNHIITQVLLVATVGGLVGLDRTAAGQFMISQPMVAAPLTGWLLGDLHAGLVIGAALELLWVLDMPVGTFVPADSTVAAVAATATAALGSPGGAALPVIGFSILLTAGMAPVTMKADDVLRKNNARLAELAACPPGGNAHRRLASAHLAGLFMFFLKAFLLYLVLVPAALVLVFWFLRMPEQFHAASGLFVKLLPILGAASVARRLSMRTCDSILLAGFAVAALSVFVLHASAPAIVFLAAAVGWMGVRFRERNA